MSVGTAIPIMPLSIPMLDRIPFTIRFYIQLLCWMQVRATLEDAFTNSVRQGVGPINLNFTIPMYCASKLQVRYLQIMKHDKNYSPYRWVRYVTMSNSYVIRTR